MSFKGLNLSEPVQRAIEAKGYTEPTPIQLAAIPLLLEGRDVIGSAQTGTGKTAAFALPILSKLGEPSQQPRALIVEPTRELALQVEEAVTVYGKFTGLRAAVLYGGVGYGKQLDQLKTGVDIIIATPGRLLDHVGRGDCKLSSIEFVVLDEADRMLDMGFLPDVRRIVDSCPKKRQTALFSATIPPQIETLIQWAMNNPQTIEIGARRTPAETVKHVIYPVAAAQKTKLLLALLDHVHYESVIVFCHTRRGADEVAAILTKNKHSVATLHSDRSQKEREQALNGFRDGTFEVLVATDIAARGLDIQDVSHVVNYDVPGHPEDYIHRIGRTGRALAAGDAFTIMVAEDAPQVYDIERFISQKIPRERLSTFDYQYTALFEAEKQPDGGGRPGAFKSVRVKGGYMFGPPKTRRRRR